MNENTSTETTESETTDVVEQVVEAVNEAEQAESTTDFSDDATAVFLEMSTVGQSRNALAKASGLSRDRVRKAVTELVERGVVLSSDEGVRLVESAVEAPATRPDAESGSGLVRAIRLGHEVEYGRGQCVTERNTTVTDMLNEAKADGITVDQVADRLGITKGAARHAIWRLRGGPASKVEGGFMHKDLRICDRLKRNTFALLEYLPDPAQDTNTGSDDESQDPSDDTSVDESATDEPNTTPDDETSSEDAELATV